MSRVTEGRIVLFRHDATTAAGASGNSARAGQVEAAMIVRAWGDTETSAVNLRVFHDGPEDLWITSVSGDPTGQNERSWWFPVPEAIRESA